MGKPREPRRETPGTVTITGIVIPVEWDANGMPVAFAVSTHQEEELRFGTDTLSGKRLRRCSRQKVRVTGVVDEAANGRKTIRVECYRRLKDSTRIVKTSENQPKPAMFRRKTEMF